MKKKLSEYLSVLSTKRASSNSPNSRLIAKESDSSIMRISAIPKIDSMGSVTSDDLAMLTGSNKTRKGDQNKISSTAAKLYEKRGRNMDVDVEVTFRDK